MVSNLGYGEAKVINGINTVPLRYKDKKSTTPKRRSREPMHPITMSIKSVGHVPLLQLVNITHYFPFRQILGRTKGKSKC